MRCLELKVPPPYVWFAHLLLMLLLNVIIQPMPLTALLRWLMAFVFAVTGGSIIYIAFRAFRMAATTGSPKNPAASSTLVNTGIFAISRNPVYLGMLLVMLAICLALNNLFGLIAPLLFTLYITRFQIIPEERALNKVFGEEFVAYRQKVRRWI